MTHQMIDNLLRANLSTINRYFPGIMSVIYSDREVLDLIREIEIPPATTDALDDDEDQSDDEEEEIGFLPDTDDEDDDEDSSDDRSKPF